MKIAMLFPYAPAYRESIYKKIDETFDVEWFFCSNAERPLKMLDYSVLKNVHLDMSEVSLKGNVRYIANFDPSKFEKFDAIIFSGNIRNLSYWKLLFHRSWKHQRPKLILWTHGWYGRESVIQSAIKRFYLKRADSILLYGNHAKKLMEKQSFPTSMLFVIANSLGYDKQLELRHGMIESDIYSQKFANEAPTIVFIGRLTCEKKLDMLLNAQKQLIERGLITNIVFIGDGEAAKPLEELTYRLNLQNNVWFYGACYDEKINATLIYNADLCVSPGNVGLTAIHSLMFGCPVITHDDFSFQGPEFEAISKGDTGDFFTRNSVESLVETIYSWFRRSDYDRESIRHNCFKEIDQRWNPYSQIDTLRRVLK